MTVSNNAMRHLERVERDYKTKQDAADALKAQLEEARAKVREATDKRLVAGIRSMWSAAKRDPRELDSMEAAEVFAVLFPEELGDAHEVSDTDRRIAEVVRAEFPNSDYDNFDAERFATYLAYCHRLQREEKARERIGGMAGDLAGSVGSTPPNAVGDVAGSMNPTLAAQGGGYGV